MCCCATNNTINSLLRDFHNKYCLIVYTLRLKHYNGTNLSFTPTLMKYYEYNIIYLRIHT